MKFFNIFILLFYRALLNSAEISTDECSSGEESDNEDMANKLERMITGSKSIK